MTELDRFAELVPLDHGLCVVSTLTAGGGIHSTVVNAGVLDHPVTGDKVVAFVSAGGAKKLANLRADPRVTVVVRAGWRWATVEGDAEIVGPDDPHAEVSAEGLRVLLRSIFGAAGGSHDDWDEYDRTMVAERRAAVLVAPRREYGNP